MKNNILFIGFELESDRKEAVSINYKNHINKVLSSKYGSYNFSLSSKKNVIEHLLILPKYIIQIMSIINTKKITHIHDLFVLPLISILFLLPIKIFYPKVKLIKELHNNFGFSKIFNLETLLRIILSSKFSIFVLSKVVDTLYSRSEYLSKYWKIKYIPQYINIHKLDRNIFEKPKVFNICYLGHPLHKKGVYIFPELLSKLRLELTKIVKFNFAFSNLGSKNNLVKLIKVAAAKNRVKVEFSTEVKPYLYFRQNHIFLLPLIDEYSATSVPNTILEAMEAGCVVITVNNKINSSVIKNDDNGYLINNVTTNSILQVINSLVLSKKAYSRMSFNSRKYVELNHNLSYIKACFNKIYEI